MKNRKKKDNSCLGTVKVGSRGQIVLPIEVRKKLDIKEGETLFVLENDSHVEIMKSDKIKKALDGVK